jgi:hypothetical protein
LRCPRLDQPCGAAVADQRVFVDDEPESEIEANCIGLIRYIRDDTIAAQASWQPIKRRRFGDNGGEILLTRHVSRLLRFGLLPVIYLLFRYILLYISRAASRTAEHSDLRLQDDFEPWPADSR